MKKLLSLIALCLLLGFNTAYAQDFWIGSVFNDSLNAFVDNVEGFDWASSGSGNAQGLGPVGTPLAVGTNFTFRYQAFLFQLTDPIGNPITPFPGLTSAFEYTVVALIPETVSGFNSAPGGTQTALFSTLPGGEFYIYHDAPANANVPAGTGFENGTVVAHGFIDSGQISTFTFIPSNNTGIGSSILTGTVDYANPTYLNPANLIVNFRFESNLNYPPLDSTTAGFFDGTKFTRYVTAANDMQFKVDGSSKFLIPVATEECRITGGGVDTYNVIVPGTYATASSATAPLLYKPKTSTKAANNTVVDYDRYTFGGQVGAPSGSPPPPCFGEWTHHQQSGFDGDFVFHAGTASAPAATHINCPTCLEPIACHAEANANNKEIIFDGIGTFKNVKGPLAIYVNPEGTKSKPPTLHYFKVIAEDLGEPGNKFSGPSCTEATPTPSGNCDCADSYQIEIHATDDPNSAIIYFVKGFLDGGNLQMHPPILH